MRNIILALAMALSASVASAQAPEPASESRVVAFELKEGDRLIGTPRLMVALGAPASMSVAGPDGYKVDVVVEQAEPDGNYLVRSAFYLPDGDDWVLVVSPSFTVAGGQEGRLIVGRADRPISMAVSVR